MFDTLVQEAPAARPATPASDRNATAVAPRPATTASAYHGPERRRGQASAWQLHALMLDEVDFGMLLLDGGGRVLHLNHAARQALDEQHPLLLQGQELRTRLARDQAPLHDALQAAAQRGLRKLLRLGDGAQARNVSVVPLGAAAQGALAGATLLMLPKAAVCGDLAVQWFARSHGLTPAETRVLEALCAGEAPSAVAARQQVAMATVRTQIGNIRAKTGAASIVALMRQVAVLPPMVRALRGAVNPH